MTGKELVEAFKNEPAIFSQLEVAVYETGDNGIATFRESMIVENVNFNAFEIGDMFFSPDDKRYVYLGEPEGCVKLLEVA